MTRAKVFTVDPGQTFPVKFFVTGYEYPLLGLIPARLHLLGVDEPGVLFPFGTDSLGRDMLTRVCLARIRCDLVGRQLWLGCLRVSGFFGARWTPAPEFLQACPPFRCGWRWRPRFRSSGRHCASTS